MSVAGQAFRLPPRARGLLLAVLLAGTAMAAGEVRTVRDIRVEGLQRISEGTVFNYLPVNIGDQIDEQRVQEALRAVYATGFFKDVEFRWDAGTLVIAVAERPSIESFTISGNKDIKTEDLTESLSKIGLKAGKIFNRSVLDEVEQSVDLGLFTLGGQFLLNAHVDHALKGAAVPGRRGDGRRARHDRHPQVLEVLQRECGLEHSHRVHGLPERARVDVPGQGIGDGDDGAHGRPSLPASAAALRPATLPSR